MQAETDNSKDIMALYSTYVLTHKCPIMFLIVVHTRSGDFAGMEFGKSLYIRLEV